MSATVDRKLKNALTAAELISELEGMDPDAVVLFVCDYGDHCHTQQALPIRQVEEMQRANISESAYSQSGLQLVESDGDDDELAAELEEMTPEERAAYDAATAGGEAPVVILQ